MGRKNRRSEPVWSPDNAARIRAGLVYGHSEQARAWGVVGTEVGNAFEDLVAELDDAVAGHVSLSPAERGELESALDETQELLADVEASQLASMLVAGHLEMSPVLWLDDSSVARLREANGPAADPAAITSLGYAGLALFETSVGRFEVPMGPDEDGADEDTADLDTADQEPLVVDVEGLFWWVNEYDPAKELGDDDFDDFDDDDDHDLDDEAELVTELVLHVLSRVPGERARLEEAWRLPVLVDIDTVAINLDDTDQPPLPVGADVLARLAISMPDTGAQVMVSEHGLPPAKQTYAKNGWPALAPLESVSIVTAVGR